MSIDKFYNRLGDSFDDNIDDLQYLLTNKYITPSYPKDTSHTDYYYVLKSFKWGGKNVSRTGRRDDKSGYDAIVIQSPHKVIL